jgi:hypothetical protein
VGAWGFVGPVSLAPKQTSQPPTNGGVLGQYHGTGPGGSTGAGVVGIGSGYFGVWGSSDTENGVHGDSTQGDAVVGIAHAAGKAGALGISDNGNGVSGISQHGVGVFGSGGTWAGSFLGNVQLTGQLHCGGQLQCGDPNKPGVSITPDGTVNVLNDVILTNHDCAEDFAVAEEEGVAAGTVMVIDGDGVLRPCAQAYDRRVAGVVSGAGDCKPGIVLGRRKAEKNKVPVALVGRVYCKVEARGTPIEIGDLLTTSDTMGHAMKAADHARAFGSVIGKAMRPLAEGRGLIPILVALQ